MAKVSLRIYNREIESLVENGQLDEAIAHCRHILNVYPKHLETYRMLGKAYLEARRYDEATDIFERVLMAVPDDFVAQVGMSIIRDEQKNLDAAIWHMQRAFEVQPSNAAIQSELQRLYGRRDGIEPPKIRLTRGALAHMYVQGELYPQAISEITGVLEEDPERQDMQVLLARAYFHAGQKSESAEICSQLLRRYPYCFDANRVLVELLPQTEQGESVQTYRKRINELNPYIAFITGSVFHTDDIPDAAVSLERLEWDGQPVDIGPDWGESQGIGLVEKPVADGEEPDWLKTDLTSGSFDSESSSQDDEPAHVSEGLPIPTVSTDKDEIPEFLRAAGWSEDTGTFQEGQSSFEESDEPSEDLSIAEGDLPDWVIAMAPTGADDESADSTDDASEDLTQDDVPDWLQGIGDAQSMPSDEQPLEKADIPEWLEAEKPVEEMMPEQEPQEQPMAEPADNEDVPDWLESIQPDDKQVASEEAPQKPVLESDEMSEELLANWQIEDEETASEVEFDKTDTGELGASAAEQDDAIAWLEGLASKHGAKPEELVTDPNARSETEPDWVQKAKATKEQVDAEAPVPQERPESQEDLPDFIDEEQAEPMEEPKTESETVEINDLGTSAEEQDDAVAWLESLATKHGAKPEELVTDPEARKETAPDWVQKASDAGAEQPPVEQAPVKEPVESEQDTMEHARQVGESLYAELEEAQMKDPIPSADDDETGIWLQELKEERLVAEEKAAKPEVEGDIPDWLSEVDSKTIEQSELPEAESVLEMESIPETETGSEPVSEAESESPDWLKSMEAESSGADALDSSADDLPSWLAGLDEDSDQAQPAVASDDLPEWLRAEAEGEPIQPEPTSPTDWQPAEIEGVGKPTQVEIPAPLAGPEAETEEITPEPELQLDEAPDQTAPTPAPEPKPEPEPQAPPERPAHQEPVTRSRSGMTGLLSPAQDPALTEAQNELTRGNIPGAMGNYGKLIKKGKMLEEIIFDLREALYRYPVEVTILQTLGDAYMRANRLQEALDSYTKAEELLR